MGVKFRAIVFFVICFLAAPLYVAHAQEPVEQVPVEKDAPPPEDNKANAPRSDEAGPDESSSRQTQIDISPPSLVCRQDRMLGISTSRARGTVGGRRLGEQDRARSILSTLSRPSRSRPGAAT